MNYEEAWEFLQVYSLSDILELNDLSEEEVLCFLVDQEFVTELPPEPVSY